MLERNAHALAPAFRGHLIMRGTDVFMREKNEVQTSCHFNITNFKRLTRAQGGWHHDTLSYSGVACLPFRRQKMNETRKPKPIRDENLVRRKQRWHHDTGGEAFGLRTAISEWKSQPQKHPANLENVPRSTHNLLRDSSFPPPRCGPQSQS